MKSLILIFYCLSFSLTTFGQNSEQKIGFGFDEQETTNSNDCINQKFRISNENKKSVFKLDTVYDRREFFIDSMNLEIVIKEYLNGNSIVRSAKNKTSNITYWNQYHNNGEIKWKGFTSGYILRIGKWEHYSEEGILDSIADYSMNRVLNYCDVRNMLGESGIEFDDFDYNYNYELDRWELKNWTNNNMGYLIDNRRKLVPINE